MKQVVGARVETEPGLARATAGIGGASPSFFALMPDATRGSRLTAATTFSPSLNLNRLWMGSPYPVEAGTSVIRAV